MSNLEDIKNRLAAATPGPWMKDPDEPVHIMKPDKPGFSWDGTIIATLQRDDFGLFEEANADLIAHAPEDIARLVKALEAVEGQLLWAEACKTQWTSVNSLRSKITEALDS